MANSSDILLKVNQVMKFKEANQKKRFRNAYYKEENNEQNNKDKDDSKSDEQYNDHKHPLIEDRQEVEKHYDEVIENIKDRIETVQKFVDGKEEGKIWLEKLSRINNDLNDIETRLKNKREEVAEEFEVVNPERQVIRSMRKYRNRSCVILKEEIDTVYSKISIYEEKIIKAKEQLNKLYTKAINKNGIKKEYEEAITKCKNEINILEEKKGKYEDEFREKLNEFLDDIDERKNIIKNLYVTIQLMIK